MGLDTTVIAMIEPSSAPLPDDPAPPLMTDDSARGAARLSELMAVEDSPAVEAAAGTALPIDGARGDSTLGDAILGKLDRISQRYESVTKDAYDAMTSTDTHSLQSLLGVQIKLVAVALEVEVISKGVGKAVQHFDQLTKLQ